MSENVVNLFDMEAEDKTMSFLDKKSASADGIFRPSLKDAKDKNKGYVATIRFLPNLLEDGGLGPSALEKHSHYANLPDYPELQGYYDSLVNFGEKCPLTTLFWKLKNSKNQAEVERAELIGRTTKYYSYVLIIEDEQHPENVGKIMIYPYGFKIKEKINLERTGDNADGKKCNVFDPANGKDFRLSIKQVGDWPNYDACMFRNVSPLKIWDAENERFIETLTEWDEDKGKFRITNTKVQQKLVDFLNNSTVKLTDHEAKPWTEEQKGNVEKIIDILTGKHVASAKGSIDNATSSSYNDTLEGSSLDENDGSIDNFFDDEE